MKNTLLLAASLGLALSASQPALAQKADAPVTPNSVVEAAQPDEWTAIPASDLMVMHLAPDAAGKQREVVIQLMPKPFSQGWVDNIRLLANTHFWDGTTVYRVVDNWVTQWGDGEDNKDKAKPLPEGIKVVPESEYVTEVSEERALSLIDRTMKMIRAESGDGEVTTLGMLNDTYAKGAIFVDGWPIGTQDAKMWPTHCYASVGVARDLTPDTGTGAELYTVIGHAPRQLDRNIAVVGRVIEGMEHLSTLPRGTGDAGVYADPAQRVPIEWVRMASELAPDARPKFEYLATGSASFAKYYDVRANRQDGFYQIPAGGVDICNVQVPVRRVKER